MNAWQKIEQLGGRTLHTIGKARKFTLDIVRPAYLVVIPDGGDPRLIRRGVMERAAAIRSAEGPLTRARLVAEFPGSRNSSYIVAIVEELAKASEA